MEIYFWKSITTSNYNITPELSYYGSNIRVKLNGSCLKQNKITFTYGKTGNVYIVYDINKNYGISSYATLENCFFGAVSLTKNNDIDKCNFPDIVLDLIEKELFQ